MALVINAPRAQDMDMNYLAFSPNIHQCHPEELAAVSWSINEMVYS